MTRPWEVDGNPTLGQARNFTDILAALPNGWGQYSAGQFSQPKIYEPKGSVFYVSNSTANGMILGNDSTGTGTFANPWLTIDKALATVATTGDATIYVNDGTYSESSLGTGRLVLRTLFTDWVSVEPVSGRRGGVTITTASSSAGAINFTSSYSCSKIQFRKCQIQPGSTAAPAINLSSSNGTQNSVHFVECGIAGSNSGAFFSAIQFTGDGGFNDFALLNCEFAAPVNAGANQPAVIAVSPTTIAGNGKYTNFYIGGCRTAANANYQGWANMFGITNLAIIGNQITATNSYGLLVGGDISTSAIAWTQNNVFVEGNYVNVSAAAGHGILMGFGCNSTCTCAHNVVFGGLHGIVVKGATGVVVRSNFVFGLASTFLNGLYAKASTGTQFIANTVYVAFGDCFREDYDNTTGVKSQNTALYGNRLIATGNATLVTWQNSTGSNGGAMADYNVYELRGSANFGQLRTHTITSFSDLQAAWASFGLAGDLATNDANSQQNVAGSRDDLKLSYTAGQTLYCRLARSDGNVFTGWAVEPYRAETHFRSMKGMIELATPGTYSAPVPFNLPPGKWTCLVHQLLGQNPSINDPVVGQIAVGYAS